ncbi:MAG: type VI secretion system protein ImpK [Psychrobacter glaciei]|jgi:type VI secretion system protein ImpK
MRLIDFYIDPILKINSVKDNLSQLDSVWKPFKDELSTMLIDAQTQAVKAGFPQESCAQALFPVVAFIDELVLTSSWKERLEWQRESLQRNFFNTTNSGFEFYERLNKLNRQGDDRSVREVYLLCLSLGFKGRYFSPQDRPKIEETRVFNLDLLLPNDANNVFEKSTLFSDAYHERDQINTSRQSRMNLIPVFAITPFVAVAATLIFYSMQIGSGLTNIMDLVK